MNSTVLLSMASNAVEKIVEIITNREPYLRIYIYKKMIPRKKNVYKTSHLPKPNLKTIQTIALNKNRKTKYSFTECFGTVCK